MPAIDYNCSQCGKKVSRFISNEDLKRNYKNRFCNMSCHHEFQKKNAVETYDLICKNCNKTYKKSMSTITKFCCRKCMTDYRYKNYREKKEKLKIEKTIYKNEKIENSIYFLKSEKMNFIKIGTTKNIFKRVLSMHTENPDNIKIICLIVGADKNYEKIIQNQFSKFLYRNEWFYPAKEIYDFIEKIV